MDKHNPICLTLVNHKPGVSAAENSSWSLLSCAIFGVFFVLLMIKPSTTIFDFLGGATGSSCVKSCKITCNQDSQIKLETNILKQVNRYEFNWVLLLYIRQHAACMAFLGDEQMCEHSKAQTFV
jgi:hypothetical protein